MMNQWVKDAFITWVTLMVVFLGSLHIFQWVLETEVYTQEEMRQMAEQLKETK